MKICRLVVGAVSTNCYIVADENTKEAFLVDPGAHPEKIKKKIAEEGVSVKGILLTHGHFDHIMAVDELRKVYDVKVYLGEEDMSWISDPMKNVSALFGRPYTTKADCLVKDGEALEIAGFDIKVLHTPGHTPGGVCYYLEKEGVVFSGDTIFQESVGRSDFPGGSGSMLTRSIREKIFTLPDDTQIFSGHGDSTFVSHEKKYNMFV